MSFATVLIIAAISIGAGSVKLPSNFQKCNRKDTNFDQCALKAADDGIKQLTKEFREVNLPSLKPLEILELSIKAGKQAVAVDQNFKNCKLYGFDTLKLTKIDFKFQDKEIYAEGKFPEIRKECQYDLNGKVLLLPIVGQGPSTIILSDLDVSLQLPYEEVKNKGKTYMKFTSNKFTLEPKLVSYNFENLFNGDKQLGDNINKVLNENWKEVFEDVKDGYQQALGAVAQDLFGRFFSKVSMEEAFD